MPSRNLQESVLAGVERLNEKDRLAGVNKMSQSQTPYQIPPMTHPLSSGWPQPDLREVLIDDTYAVMTTNVFNELSEGTLRYSGIPTGVYEGKTWKCKNQGQWLLRWYETISSGDPLLADLDKDYCRILSREVLLV